MDSVRVIVDGLFEEMVGQVKEMIMLPPKESAGTTSAEPSTPKLPVSTSTVLPSQEHQQHQEEEENQQQHQDGRRRSPSPSALEPPAKVPRLIEKPAVGGGDEPTVVEDEPTVEPGLVAPRPVIRGVCPECGGRFRDNEKQQEHWWRDHAGVLPFICSYPGQELAGRDEWCGHLALTRWNMKRHAKESHPGGKSGAEAMVVDLRLLDTWPTEVARQQKAFADPEEGKRAATKQKKRHNVLLKRLGIFGKKPHTRNKRS